jgi:4-hydroxymandelate oxidase
LAPQSLVFAHSVEHHSLLFRSCTVGAGVRVEENAIIEAGADVPDSLRVRPNRAVHAARQVAEVSATQRVPDVDAAAMEHLAEQKLAPAIFQYFAGGSETGRALQRNLDSFAEIAICPRRLRDVSNVSLATTLLGRTLSSPILIAPSAMHRLLHPDGELATSRAVAAGNMGMVLSMLSTSPLEQVVKPFAEARGLPLFQLYCLKDRSVVNSLVKRAEACGYQGLVVTVDSPASGKLTVDPRAWMKFSQEMSLPHLPGVEDSALSPLARFESMKDPSLTFKDLVSLQETTRLPIWLKGILSPGDAVMAAALGFRGIILSNHGGRRLDAEVSALEMVSAIRLALDRAGHEVTLLVDGGIRHGNDVFKALALGADAVLVGRAPLWGLAVAGEAGVAQVLKRMNEELVMAMKLAGCSALGELTPDLLYIKPGKFAVSSRELWGSPH